MILRQSTFSEKPSKNRFLHPFWPPQTLQNHSKIAPKSRKIAFRNENKSQHASLQLRLMGLNARGARLNVPHPASQAQETP